MGLLGTLGTFMTIPPSLPTTCMKSQSLLHFTLFRCHYVQVLPITAGSLWQLSRYIIRPQEIDATPLFLIYYRLAPRISMCPKGMQLRLKSRVSVSHAPPSGFLAASFFKCLHLARSFITHWKNCHLDKLSLFFSYFLSTEPCCPLPSSSSMEPFPLFP